LRATAEDRRDVRPRLGRGLHLHATGVHRLGVGHDHVPRKLLSERADRVEPFALEERGSDLEDVDARLGGLARRLQRAAQLREIERELELGRHAGGLRISSKRRSWQKLTKRGAILAVVNRRVKASGGPAAALGAVGLSACSGVCYRATP
jgi:hypothetical protein